MARKEDERFGLLAHLDKLMDDLHENVPKAVREFNVDGIHDARVATRRLKAALGLLQSVLSDHRRQDLDKVLRKIRRRLGPLRDMDVMIEHLAGLESQPNHHLAAGWLKSRLEVRRERERVESREKAGSADLLSRLGAWWHVREEIVDAREAVDSLLAESLHLQLDSFVERADGIVQQHAGDSSSTERHDPHELRIAGKLLRYTLELAQSEGHELPVSVMRQFKRMQETLGTWHDDVVLVQCAMQMSLDEKLAYHDLAQQEKLLDLARFFLRHSSRGLSNFSTLWKKRGHDVVRTIRERFPLTLPIAVNESKTDHDLSDSNGTPAQEASVPTVASAV